MNKKEFINKRRNELDLDLEKCIIINNILEDTFLIGKKNKEIMIDRFVNELNISIDDANNIYEKVMDIIKNAIKNKIKHPFKGKD